MVIKHNLTSLITLCTVEIKIHVIVYMDYSVNKSDMMLISAVVCHISNCNFFGQEEAYLYYENKARRKEARAKALGKIVVFYQNNRSSCGYFNLYRHLLGPFLEHGNIQCPHKSWEPDCRA